MLLFGHSFSDRLKFWSEYELEHSFNEGGEESGEIALEQAYLDSLKQSKQTPEPPVGFVSQSTENTPEIAIAAGQNLTPRLAAGMVAA